MRVLLSLSGTYPYFRGGVSTWTHELTARLPGVEFHLVSVVSNADVTPRFALSPNVRLTTVPLWGAARPEEVRAGGAARRAPRTRRPGAAAFRRQFLPAYETTLRQLLYGAPDPRALAEALASMGRFFRRYDFYATLRHPAVWRAFLGTLDADRLFSRLTMIDAISLCRRLERQLRVLTVPIERADVAHVAVAGIGGVPAILAKIAYGIPLLLTEHGVYYRERLLDLINEEGSTPLKVFLTNFEHALVRLNYAFADLTAPVCQFNSRWEVAMGVPPARVKVIYNGVDTDRFEPGPALAGGPPTVVSVGRIDRLKDTVNLIDAMAYVRHRVPAVRCLIYGEATDPAYRRLCATRIEELGLSETVTLKPSTPDPEHAYRAADLVVNASLSEGFPFGVIEAMACGKMVVATDVGGVREALDGCGVLVPPRAPKALGMAIAAALQDAPRRQECGARGRARATERYQVVKMAGAYQDVYQRLASH
jgi:glycosyltransferase involved in cell wall biosynthesis